MSRRSNIAYHPTLLAAREEADDSARPSGAREIELRRDVSPCLERTADQIDERIQEELETLRRWIDIAVKAIAQDPILRHRHAAEIGHLGRVEQTLHRLGRVIVAADKEAAVKALDMTELKARLLRKSITAPFEARH